ncbi:MAG: motility protein A [Phycisphaerales bacterium]
MDKGRVVGSLLMFVCCMVVFWKATHGDLWALYSEKGFIMVIGGTTAVILMALPLDKCLQAMKYIKKYFLGMAASPIETIKLMNKLGEKARREGILSLEGELAQVKDKFLAAGLKMAVDGTDAATIEGTLRMEVMAMQERHKAGKKFFDLIKVYGPGIALTATLIGQIGMFSQLGSGDIELLGHMLAVAVVATMYGTVLANCVAGPMGDKLALKSAEEILTREMVLQGILSIQAGENPRVTLDKMSAFLPVPARAKVAA